MGKALSVTVAVAFAVAAFGFGVRVAGIADPAGHVGPPEWRMYLALGMSLAGLGLVIVMLVRVLPLRKGYGLHAWRSLTRAQRRYASRQLRGKLPVAPPEAAFLRPIALHRVQQRVLVLQHAGIALIGGGETVFSEDPFGLATGGIMVIFAVVGFTVVSYDVANMTTFLNYHGWPTQPRSQFCPRETGSEVS